MSDEGNELALKILKDFSEKIENGKIEVYFIDRSFDYSDVWCDDGYHRVPTIEHLKIDFRITRIWP